MAPAPDFDDVVRGSNGDHDGDDEERMIYSLCDAVLMLFHLLGERREPLACRDLRHAVRCAVTAEPMAEVVEIRTSTWEAIKGIGFAAALLASRKRFDDTWLDDE